MTLKTMINDVQAELSLPVTSTIASSTEAAVRQLTALANRTGRSLMRRYPWESLTQEHTFTTVAAETQTDTPIPTDFDRMVNESVYNRTRNRKVTGPLNPNEWQAQKGITASVLTDSFRIRGGSWLSTPTPAAGDTIAYSYITKNWVTSSSEPAGPDAEYDHDDDEAVLDEELIGLGVIWRWKRAKGLDYSEEFAEYERYLLQAMSQDGAKRALNFATDISLVEDARPPTVPEGNWAL